MRLILASSSPYRQELLARLRLPFEAVAADAIDYEIAKNELAAYTRKIKYYK